MKSVRFLSVFFLLTFVALGADSDVRRERVEKSLLDAPGPTATPAVEHKSLVERMNYFKVPGVSIAVIDGGEIAWARGYGVLEAGTRIAVTPETLFQAASLSKPVTAVAALHMARFGHFGLDDDVNQKLRSWKVPENNLTARQPVTLRGILTHSAGLTVHGFRGYATGEQVPALLQVLDGRPPSNSPPIRVDIEPGSQSRYSGGGFTVLQQLMIDSFGKPFPELMNIIVLRQTGMVNSTFEQPLPEGLRSRAATAHGSDGLAVGGKWHTYPELAAAGLWTTPTDVARFIIMLQKSFAGESDRILSQKLAQEMLSRQPWGGGLGLGLRGEGEAAFFSHSGGNEGFRCFFAASVRRGQGAVVMTNSDNGDRLVMEIIRAIAAEYDWRQ